MTLEELKEKFPIGCLIRYKPVEVFSNVIIPSEAYLNFRATVEGHIAIGTELFLMILKLGSIQFEQDNHQYYERVLSETTEKEIPNWFKG